MPSTAFFLYSDTPLPVTPPSHWPRIPLRQTFTYINTLAISSQLLLFKRPTKMEQSGPKRRHIKFRRRGITQKKEYYIHNTAKAWNHVHAA